MTTVFGLPAVDVKNPDGEVVPYLVREVTATSGEMRAWIVTKNDGTEYRVIEWLPGWFRCACKDFLYRRRSDVESGGKCKHARALAEHLGDRS